MDATALATSIGTVKTAPCVRQSTTSRLDATSALMDSRKSVILTVIVSVETNETALVTLLLGPAMTDYRSALVPVTNSGSHHSAKIAIRSTTTQKIPRNRTRSVVIAALTVMMAIRIAGASAT
jgi:hypothetical protein